MIMDYDLSDLEKALKLFAEHESNLGLEYENVYGLLGKFLEGSIIIHANIIMNDHQKNGCWVCGHKEQL